MSAQAGHPTRLPPCCRITGGTHATAGGVENGPEDEFERLILASFDMGDVAVRPRYRVL